MCKENRLLASQKSGQRFGAAASQLLTAFADAVKLYLRCDRCGKGKKSRADLRGCRSGNVDKGSVKRGATLQGELPGDISS